jgi:hypothetical protein
MIKIRMIKLPTLYPCVHDSRMRPSSDKVSFVGVDGGGIAGSGHRLCKANWLVPLNGAMTASVTFEAKRGECRHHVGKCEFHRSIDSGVVVSGSSRDDKN